MADKTYDIGYLEKEAKSVDNSLIVKNLYLTNEQVVNLLLNGTLELTGLGDTYDADIIVVINKAETSDFRLATVNKIAKMENSSGTTFTGIVERSGNYMYVELLFDDAGSCTISYKKIIQQGKKVIFPTLSSISGYAVSLDGTVQTISINTKTYDNVNILSYTIPNSVSLSYDNTKGILLSKTVENNNVTYLFYVKGNLTFSQRP